VILFCRILRYVFVAVAAHEILRGRIAWVVVYAALAGLSSWREEIEWEEAKPR
jgi:hypothetical protein